MAPDRGARAQRRSAAGGPPCGSPRRRPRVAYLYTVMSLLRSCRLVSSEAPTLPKFKWGQSKEKVFLTISVRDLRQGSERVEFEEDRVRFSASDAEGKAYGLDLELRQDVDPAACAWEPLPRPDRHGKSVLVTLAKRFPSAWDSLVTDAGRYRKVMERDWAREDDKLGSAEEDQYERGCRAVPLGGLRTVLF
ncbi:unnamed protein product, partial [Prorocentrum cordatum]